MIFYKTTSRRRTVLKTFSSATLGGLETAFATYESDKCDDDTTKTWEVRIVSSFWDGSNYILIAEACFVEWSDDLTPIPVGT